MLLAMVEILLGRLKKFSEYQDMIVMTIGMDDDSYERCWS